MTTFSDALRLAGLVPRDVVADGKIRRCATTTHPHKRNGWYVLHPDGRGVFGDWSTGSSEAMGTWRDERLAQMPLADRQRLEAQALRRREREREDRRHAIAAARTFWARCRPVNRLHPYIERKGLSAFGCAGLRVFPGPTLSIGRQHFHEGSLVIPINLFGGGLISVQAIAPGGTKLYWPGAPVQRGHYVIERQRFGITALVEGLATGLAVFQAVRTARVIVCFDAGNLAPVAQALRPTGSVVICADNDHGTLVRRGFNPGIDKARNAAELLGAGVTWPQGIEGTDFADALAEIGEGAHRGIERQVLAAARFVPLAAPP